MNLRSSIENTLPVGGRRRLQAGALLLELMIALTVLTIGLLGFLYAFQVNFTASRDIGTRDLASAAFSNAVETLLDGDFSTLYSSYNGSTLVPPTGMETSASDTTEMGQLVDEDGNPARVVVTFYVNETSLPAEFGPVVDIDGDGALNSVNCSTTYLLLPARFTITYQAAAGVRTQDFYLVIGPRE